MIDMHTHILPCFDDGSKSLEISRELLEMEIKNGVSKVVLTPHQNIEFNDKDDVLARFEVFKDEVKDIDIDLMLGCEIYYHEGLVKYLKANKYLTINNSKYLLVEFSTTMETPIADIIYELVVAGYKPIVAHIERYTYLTMKDYNEIRANGALIQVNANSFTKRIHIKKLKYLLKNNLLDFIASDCHNLDYRNVDFDFAKKYIMKKFKNQYNKFFVDDFNFND